MSFNDINGRNAQKASTIRTGGPTVDRRPVADDPITELSNELQVFQRICVTTKDKITEMRRRKVSEIEKNEIDARIRDIRQIDSKLKLQLDQQSRVIEALPKTDSTQKRHTLAKLQKDYDRLKGAVSTLSNEASLIKPVAGLNAPASSIPQMDGVMEEQMLKTTVLLSGREVDEAILEERERDIKKINQDIHLINEMFRDMAELVEKQGDSVQQIAKDTDTAHERAHAGLEQVQQAAKHQTTCCIS